MSLSIIHPNTLSPTMDAMMAKLSGLEDPLASISHMKKEFEDDLKKIMASKRSRRALKSFYTEQLNEWAQELDEIERELEKLVLLEKLTHYAPELDKLFLQLYALRNDPERFTEMQHVVALRKAMMLFEANRDVYTERIHILDEGKQQFKGAIRKLEIIVRCSSYKGGSPMRLMRKVGLTK